MKPWCVHYHSPYYSGIGTSFIGRIYAEGSGFAVSDLIGGQVQLMFATAGSVAQHVKSGRLRALAVTSAQPSALAPGLPTLAASGVPGYESVTMYGIYAPANSPAMLINRLNREADRFLDMPDTKERFFNAGVETVGGSPQDFAAAIKSDMARLGKVIKDAGIRAE
jgi:tripartite-type tricarboxylate transporter receptor subunit TctC